MVLELLRTDFALTLPHSTNQMKLPRTTTARLWRYCNLHVRGSVYYAAPEQTRDQSVTQRIKTLSSVYFCCRGEMWSIRAFFSITAYLPLHTYSAEFVYTLSGEGKTKLHPQRLLSLHAVRSTVQMIHTEDLEVVLLTRHHGCISRVTV